MKTIKVFLIALLLAVTPVSFAVNPYPATSTISTQIQKFTKFPKMLKARNLSGDATVFFTINSENKIEVQNVIGNDKNLNAYTAKMMEGREIEVPEALKHFQFYIKIRYVIEEPTTRL